MASGSQQHRQNGVLSTSFSAWGTENSLAEINLESTGGDRGLLHFWGSKIDKHLQLCGQAHDLATTKISSTESSWKNPLNTLQKAIHYSFKKFCI